jgi:hypothetical protein
MQVESTENETGQPKLRRLALIAIVVGHVIAIATTILLRELSGSEFEARDYRLIGLAICGGQSALIGLWFGFGNKRSPGRLMVCVSILLVLWLLLLFGIYRPYRFDLREAVALACYSAAPFAVVSLCALMMRRAGLRLRQTSECSSDIPPGRLQFTTMDLFAFTTVVAILVAIVSTLRNVGINEVDGIGVMTLVAVGAVLPTFFVVLSGINLIWRILLAALPPFVVIPLYVWIDGWPLCFQMVLPVEAISLASLLVFRWMGYRLYVRSRIIR